MKIADINESCNLFQKVPGKNVVFFYIHDSKVWLVGMGSKLLDLLLKLEKVVYFLMISQLEGCPLCLFKFGCTRPLK